MRSHLLSLEQYNTDKIHSHYLDRYDPVFAPWVDNEITLLELGVDKGGSLQLWRDYFPRGTIVGVDIKMPAGFVPGERIKLFQGSQDDRPFLSNVARSAAPGGFDIIIDDASHIGVLTKASFWHLFDNYLKPGGLYVIEDWGTGYWSDWPDGKSLNLDTYLPIPRWRHSFWRRVARKIGLKRPMLGHNYGMVGLIKQLIDEQAAVDSSRGSLGSKPKRVSKFENMIITPSIVFVKKGAS